MIFDVSNINLEFWAFLGPKYNCYNRALNIKKKVESKEILVALVMTLFPSENVKMWLRIQMYSF